MDLYHAGIPVGTDLGHLILFGYGLEDYPGRGPIEAFGDGMELIGGDIAFRCNFATVDHQGLISDRRAGRIRLGTDKLAAALNGLMIDGIQVLFKEATEHRAVLVFRGPGLSARVSDTDPKKEGQPIKKAVPKDDSPEAAFTANILNLILQKAPEILKDLPLNKNREQLGLPPANAIVTRGAGQMTKTEKITDLMGHDNNPVGKVQAINCYNDLIGEVMKGIKEQIEVPVIIALAADHSTPCERKEHSGDPVPIMISGRNIRKDKVTAYNEIACAEGGLGRIKGNDFICTLLDYLEVTEKQGN